MQEIMPILTKLKWFNIISMASREKRTEFSEYQKKIPYLNRAILEKLVFGTIMMLRMILLRFEYCL